MKNNIAGLSMSFSHMTFQNINLISFNSYASLLDYDIVLIDLNHISLEYPTDKLYEGKKLLTKNSSFQFLDDYKRLKTEINDLLELGKTIYVHLPIEPVFYIYTGRQEHSGTGRNRQTSNIVKDFNILDILPIKLEMITSFGSKIAYTTDPIYSKLFEIKDMDYCYTTYFDSSDQGTPIAYVANTKKLIAKSFPVSNGHLIVLPPVFDEESYSTEKKYRQVINAFLHTIDDLEEEIKISHSDFSLPEWTKKYNVLDEKMKKEKIKEIEIEINQLQSELEVASTSLLEIQKYKLALTSTGKELENIVHNILIELGFQSEVVEHNRADGIFKYGKHNIVAEVKGVNGSSAEKHGAQLEKWVSEFMEKKGSTPKGLLIVNGFRKKDISARTEAVFPNQMINYSVKREHCLISTTQLLGLFIEVKNDPKKKDFLINELLNTVGVYDKFKDYKIFL